MKSIIRLTLLIGLLLLISSVYSWGANTPKTPDELLTEGKRFYDTHKYDKAQKSFQRLIDTYPTSSMIDDARYFKGMCLYHKSAYEEASLELKIVVERYPASEWADDAQLQIGLCNLKRAPEIQLDQNQTKQALLDFYALIDEFPDSDRMGDVYAAIAEARNRLAEKDYMTARFYQRSDYYKSAIIYYENIIKDYSTYPRIADAYYNLGYCQYKLGKFNDARANYQKVLDLYPDSNTAHKATRALSKLPQEGIGGGN